MAYLLHVLTLVMIYLPLAMSLNLVLGYAGMLSIGHSAFACLGSYAFALLALHGVGFVPALIAAMAACAIVGCLVGAPALRLKGDYFVLASLGFLAVTFAVTYSWVGVTGGPYGLLGIPRPGLGPWRANSQGAFAAVAALCTLGSVAVVARLSWSPFGRTLKAIRSDELVAGSLGKSVPSLKVQAFALSGALAAVSGALYASYMSCIDPTVFSLDMAIMVLSMVVLGGSGNLRGPVIGTLVVVLLPEALRFVHVPSQAAPQVRQILFGLALVLMMVFRPRGLAGEYELR